LLRQNEVPAEQIIVFHKDDVTNDKKCNPRPGTLCNDLNLTTDYRKGLQIDYTGRDVSVENVLAVYQGEKDKVRGGNGHVLQRRAF
jgi:glycosylphosphatidylinositol transamidase (GPIT) subunit GPI8